MARGAVYAELHKTGRADSRRTAAADSDTSPVVPAIHCQLDVQRLGNPQHGLDSARTKREHLACPPHPNLPCRPQATWRRAIAACGGDAREAVKARIVIVDFLEAQVAELRAAVSTGYSRGRHAADAATKSGRRLADDGIKRNDFGCDTRSVQARDLPPPAAFWIPANQTRSNPPLAIAEGNTPDRNPGDVQTHLRHRLRSRRSVMDRPADCPPCVRRRPAEARQVWRGRGHVA